MDASHGSIWLSLFVIRHELDLWRERVGFFQWKLFRAAQRQEDLRQDVGRNQVLVDFRIERDVSDLGKKERKKREKNSSRAINML